MIDFRTPFSALIHARFILRPPLHLLSPPLSLHFMLFMTIGFLIRRFHRFPLFAFSAQLSFPRSFSSQPLFFFSLDALSFQFKPRFQCLFSSLLSFYVALPFSYCSFLPSCGISEAVYIAGLSVVITFIIFSMCISQFFFSCTPFGSIP